MKFNLAGVRFEVQVPVIVNVVRDCENHKEIVLRIHLDVPNMIDLKRQKPENLYNVDHP